MKCGMNRHQLFRASTIFNGRKLKMLLDQGKVYRQNGCRHQLNCNTHDTGD